MNIDECRVLPNHQTVFLTDSDLSQAKGLNGCQRCLIWGVTWFACWFVVAMIGQAILGRSTQEATAIVMFVSFAFGVVVATVCVIVVSSILKRRNIGRLEIEKNEKERAMELHRVNRLTHEARDRYKSAIDLKRELPEHLDGATRSLTRAENEYHGNAFGPFWDAVENAAVRLSTFNNKARTLSYDAEKYDLALTDQTHTFPSFPVQASDIPDPSTTVSQMSRVVRMGQTNFEFASILGAPKDTRSDHQRLSHARRSRQ